MHLQQAYVAQTPPAQNAWAAAAAAQLGLRPPNPVVRTDLVTNSIPILFCWLYEIKDRFKKVTNKRTETKQKLS